MAHPVSQSMGVTPPRGGTKLEKYGIHNSEEKESMTRVPSKVRSLPNRGILTVKHYRIYIQKLL